jgi:hypothetical protein
LFWRDLCQREHPRRIAAAVPVGRDDGALDSGAGNTRFLLLKPDISGLPAGVSITAAVLALSQVTNGHTDTNAATFAWHALRRAWGEGTQALGTAASGECSWNAAVAGTTNWTTPGALNTTSDRYADAAASVSLTSADANGWKEWDITTLVQAWYATTIANNGALLYVSPAAATGKASYHSFAFSEYTLDTSLRPKLTVTYAEGGTNVPYALLTSHARGLLLNGV